MLIDWWLGGWVLRPGLPETMNFVYLITKYDTHHEFKFVSLENVKYGLEVGYVGEKVLIASLLVKFHAATADNRIV